MDQPNVTDVSLASLARLARMTDATQAEIEELASKMMEKIEATPPVELEQKRASMQQELALKRHRLAELKSCETKILWEHSISF